MSDMKLELNEQIKDGDNRKIKIHRLRNLENPKDISRRNRSEY